MTEETVIYQCSNIGIAGTTPVHVKQHEDGMLEARCGFALMGATNMTEEAFAACDHNPFHEKFYDNYSTGKGEDEGKAIAQLKANMKATADSLWV
ncbi:MAG: hypothetical protein EPN21_13285 [Methylococcaceae bacterium]|nr:MAG: hypothetical protein EPN21_13285 [Methylococcaceae bacterium]